MIEITENGKEVAKIERIKRIVRTWRNFDDDDRYSMYDKNFTARCILAEILRIVEENND